MRRARASTRLRITAGALAVVVAAFVLGGIAVIGVLERELIDQIDTTLRANADFIDRSLTASAPLPMEEGPTDLYVQFVGDDGAVVGAGTAAAGLASLAPPAGTPAGEIVTVTHPELGDLRVLAEPAPGGGGMTIVVARSSESVAEVVGSLQRLLLALVVAGSALVGLVIWVVVGRALRPVEEMRRTVEGISDRDLAQRLDAPGTGDELDRLADTLNDLLGRLDAAIARERQFVADASHELRTPIAGMRALLETEPADPAAVIEVRAEALERLGRLQDLVEDLLVLARADATEFAELTAPVDLDELVLGQARQLERTTNLRVDTTRVSGGQVAGRDIDLGRVVENLATNAARHAETTVAFSVRQVGSMVEFTVSDDGPGIAEGDRNLIFERFRTLEAGRSAGSGAGLGLSIAATIVAAHRGSICADDAPGHGAVFVVRLPAMEPV